MIHRELTRYGLHGAAFVLLNISIQIFLVEVGGLHPAIAGALSTASMPFFGYVLMNRFVFPKAGAEPRPRQYLTRFVQYYAVNMVSKIINYALFLGFLFVGLWYPVAYLCGAIIVFLLSFIVNRRLWHGQFIT